MKDIKDYLHLYLPCPVELDNGGSKIYSRIAVACGNMDDRFRYVTLREGNGKNSFTHTVLFSENRVKPILRPLSDMTEAEVDTVWGLFGWNNRITNFQERMMNILWEFNPPDEEFEPDWRPGRWEYLISALPYLLKQGFDIFSLIEAGLAIDITKLNKEK